MTAKVAVCVPVYNGAAFVRDVLSAIQNQSYRDLEVLISVDRGMTTRSKSAAPSRGTVDSRSSRSSIVWDGFATRITFSRKSTRNTFASFRTTT